MELTIESERAGAWTILTVSGELDLHTSPALQSAISELIEDGTQRVAIDLEHVGFMDSSSLGVLVTALKHLRERGGDLALVAVNGSPRKVLALTGIDRLVVLHASVDELPDV